MEKFTTITTTAAPMPLPNIDTDMIIPGRFLKTVKRTGLGKVAFYRMRFNDDGSEKIDFVLNKLAYRNAGIIVAGDNFGCGSSREHAPWALLDFGIRCVISTSFADIFFNNASKNGILCIQLSSSEVRKLMGDAENAGLITVNLADEIITCVDESYIKFEIEPHRKHNLLNGLDEIGITLKDKQKIAAFEKKLEQEKSWL